jgi:hypothetical protein
VLDCEAYMQQDKEKKEDCTSDLCLKPRPLWQRVVYPFIGMVLVILGIILWIMPVVMGFPLIIMGVPFLFCFNPRLELWIRRKMHTIRLSLMNKIKHK